MIRFKLSYLVASLACATAIALVSSHAFADNNYDCSKLKQWSSDRTYKKGEVVWIRASGMNDGSAWKCAKDTCRGAGDNQPYLGHIWESVGGCKSGTRPK
jgi:hypothetical protein